MPQNKDKKMPRAEEIARGINHILQKHTAPEKLDDGWLAYCPVHEADGDHNPSLLVFHEENGSCNVICRSGCRPMRVKQVIKQLLDDVDILGAAQNGDEIAWWENDGTPEDGGWQKHALQPAFDGAVDASGMVSEAAGGGLRKIETGKVQQYAAIMFVALALLAGAFIALV